MASATTTIMIEQARLARDRATRLRAVARGINAPDVLAHIEALVCEIEEAADRLEKGAALAKVSHQRSRGRASGDP